MGMKDTFSQGGALVVGVALRGSIAASVATAAVPTVPVPPSAVGPCPLPKAAQGAVTPLPEAAGPGTGLAVRGKPRQSGQSWQPRRRQRKRQEWGRSGPRRPVGPAGAALLPVARRERPVAVRAVVRHDEAEVGRLVPQVRRWQAVRVWMGLPRPWRSTAAGPVPIPQPLIRRTLLGVVVAYLPVLQLALLPRRAAAPLRVQNHGLVC